MFHAQWTSINSTKHKQKLTSQTAVDCDPMPYLEVNGHRTIVREGRGREGQTSGSPAGVLFKTASGKLGEEFRQSLKTRAGSK